jgi:2-polyprenyl-3-methyl-5-hydroxy-6-metoxy-1,4-benzoquinol methylase
MKKIDIAGGETDAGIVIGNTFDKYGSKNPIVKHLMTEFDRTLTNFVAASSPKTIHEVGCGEGFWVMKWLEDGYEVTGTDFSSKVIQMAKDNALNRRLDPELFRVQSIYDVNSDIDSADLVVCCEVLEHLEDPEAAFEALQKIVDKYLIISVPREPLWRILNIARGKYWSELGNTPGHINHWSSGGILKLASEYFDVIDVTNPLPWTMLHCKKKT